ncbi:MAG: 23S rRNA (guanosine(2251)-2'-O)-methyltransferase RlmB, partial [Actinomycetota bacterium]
EIHKILVADGLSRSSVVSEILDAARARAIPVEHHPRSYFDARAATPVHQGIMALASAYVYATLKELLAIPMVTGQAPFFLVLDGITDPHNFGALLRSAEAAGVHGVIAQSRRSAPLGPTVAKASAGAVEHLPVASVVNLCRALEEIKAAGVWAVGLDASAPNDLFSFELADEPVAIVVGSEGAGLSRLVREACEVVVRIPMAGKVSSLNASVAGALALFEVRRRRSAAR